MQILLFIAGLAFLLVGAELLVRGASRLAALMGISPLVIGLTVVAFGTSAPELAVSVKSALAGQPGVALGNVVGSNIFNILFILGVSAIVVPLVVSRQLIRFDVPLMVVLSCLVLALCFNGTLSRMEGAFLVVGLLVYLVVLIRMGRAPDPGDAVGAPSAQDRTAAVWVRNGLYAVGGLALLVLGSRWLVDGAVAFARHLGISEVIVGLTIVAAGTSLPEVVTSIMAAFRGERDIAVGNVVGSNIFNLMGVLGFAALLSPEGMPVPASFVRFDLPIMVAVAFACMPIFFTGGIISRREGVLLLVYYVAYTAYLILAASSHDALPALRAAMVYFVIPLTLLTMVIVLRTELVLRRQ